ncbi:hypothetical protein BC833DRAFT_583846 [Globomyces pollinis-pini]|nr:hypothetical protein BC833DRAFT_583846 [Globomyces pollinis-pini]
MLTTNAKKRKRISAEEPIPKLDETAQSKLDGLELAIQEHHEAGNNFVVAAALRCISEDNLFIPEKSIYAYAKKKFSFSRRTTNTYICASHVYESIVQDKSLPVPGNISHIRSLHKYTPEVRRGIWEIVHEKGLQVTEESVTAATFRYEAGTLFRDAGNELYSPRDLIVTAQRVLGDQLFSLDPASCEGANVVDGIKIANVFYNHLQDGLSQPWFGDVWLAPPESTATDNAVYTKWLRKAIDHYEKKEITSCFCLVKIDIGSQFFKEILSFPHCIFNEKLVFKTSLGRNKWLTGAHHIIFYL